MRFLNKQVPPRHPHPRSQQGITLIELMIALVIGLLATGAMLKVYVDSSRLYRFNESLARIQENGRFGLEFIRRDARMAGFWGCNSAVDPFNKLTSDTTLPDFLLNGYVTGINDDGPNGSDSITFAQAASSSIEVTVDEIDSASSASSLVPAEEYRAWEADRELLIITDCVTADIFKYNSDTELSKAYAVGSRIYRVQKIKYFIALGADLEQHSLYQLTCPALGVCTGEGDELVGGIENMQILMGEDTNPDFDGSVNRYVHPEYENSGVTGDNDLVDDHIVSTHISLLAVSPYNNVTTERAPYFFNGAWVGTDVISTDDRYLRKEFTTTVALRNKTRIRTEGDDEDVVPADGTGWASLTPAQKASANVCWDKNEKYDRALRATPTNDAGALVSRAWVVGPSVFSSDPDTEIDGFKVKNIDVRALIKIQVSDNRLTKLRIGGDCLCGVRWVPPKADGSNDWDAGSCGFTGCGGLTCM